VSEEELQGIKSKAKQAGMNLTDYVVRCCLKKQITRHIPTSALCFKEAESHRP
jgi:hypothetical protein